MSSAAHGASNSEAPLPPRCRIPDEHLAAAVAHRVDLLAPMDLSAIDGSNVAWGVQGDARPGTCQRGKVWSNLQWAAAIFTVRQSSSNPSAKMSLPATPVPYSVKVSGLDEGWWNCMSISTSPAATGAKL